MSVDAVDVEVGLAEPGCDGQRVAEVCDGWRADGRCTGPDGRRLQHPHAECLRTRYDERLEAIGRIA